MSETEFELVELAQRLGIAQAQELKDELSAALEKATQIRVDAEQVGSVDAAILQLLAAFWNESARREVSVQWLGISEVFRASVNLLGLQEALALD